jgi:hypothetical protein
MEPANHLFARRTLGWSNLPLQAVRRQPGSVRVSTLTDDLVRYR